MDETQTTPPTPPTPPDLSRMLCVLASSQLFVMQLLRNYLAAIHPRNENLERVDGIIAELKTIHNECWVRPMD